MTADKNKEISLIEYNHLNLPTKVHFVTDDASEKYIEYKYDATGVKLQKVVEIENTNNINLTDYDGGFIYEYTATNNPELKFFSHAEGYVEPNGNNFDYVYQYKDHTSTSLSAGLGNIRLSYKQETIDLGIVEEKNGFYAERSRSNPFGLKHKGYNNVVNGTEYPYGFGGKEEQNELGLKWLDFHARNYDASLGRWMNVDPLAEIMRRHSPYNYAFNNPIFWIDPDGRAPQASQTADVYYDWEEGEYRTQDGESASHEEAIDLLDEELDLMLGFRNDNGCSDCDNDTESNDDENNLLDNVNTTLTILGYQRIGLEGLVSGSVNPNLVAPSISSYFKWFARSLGYIAMGVNAAQINEATKKGDTKAQRKASLELTANLLITEGGIFAGGGVGIHAALLINPEMNDPKSTGTRLWCFIAGSKVTMVDGSEKNIENVRIGDEILSLNMKTMSIEADKILDLTNKPHLQRNIFIKLSNGVTINSSPNHPFYVKSKGWCAFEVNNNKLINTGEHLEVGDVLLYYEEGVLEEIEIIELTDKKERVPMYNIKHVKNNNTFFINKVLVHNKYLNK